MDSPWDIDEFNGEPQVVLKGSTGLQVLTGNRFGDSDYDVLVTYQVAEQVQTKLLPHTNLVCNEDYNMDQHDIMSALHHVETYAWEPDGYRVCLPSSRYAQSAYSYAGEVGKWQNKTEHIRHTRSTFRC